MTKPHFSAEPSMEDILTSIRKMISEERQGPRPVPDQLGRAPFGDTRELAARSSEPEPSPDRGPAGRSAPSFSSLSDALKAAAPGSAQRRTLEEKIADMLEDGAGPDADSFAPADSLAVFDANRSKPASPAPMQPSSRLASPAPEPDRARQSPGTETPPHRMKPASGNSSAPMNGAGSHRESRPANPGSAGALANERPPARRMPPQSRPNGAAPTGAPREMGPKDPGPQGPGPQGPGPQGPGPKDASRKDPGPRDTGPAGADPRQPDAQRIIAMPSRLPSAQGAGAAGASSTGPAMNGAAISPLGPRPIPGGADAAQPAMREADKVMAKVAEKVSDKIAGRVPDASPQHGLTKADAPAAARAEPAGRDTRAFGTAGPATDAPQAFVAKSDEGAATSSESDAAKVPSAHAPSEALIDAVVDLVHREPDSLSVFTSGSAFIHGVTGNEMSPDKPAVSTRKLDRSAAELLRPMLRQWLADNMPRIVEEALRSELISSQSADRDSEET